MEREQLLIERAEVFAEGLRLENPSYATLVGLVEALANQVHPVTQAMTAHLLSQGDDLLPLSAHANRAGSLVKNLRLLQEVFLPVLKDTPQDVVCRGEVIRIIAYLKVEIELTSLLFD